MFDSIGAMVVCVTDPKKSYIVGASETANENFRNGIQNEHLKLPEGIKKWKEDTYEETGLKKISDICENYNDIKKIIGMPSCCLSDQNGKEVRNQIQEIMNEYYSGNITKDDVMSKIKDVCKDMRVYQTQSRHTSGYNKDDNLQILSEIYELFQKTNVKQAVSACFKEGEKTAQQNGGTEINNWVYYDSDYYYESEEIKECLRMAVGELAEEWGIDPPNFTEIEDNTGYTLDGKMDFNSCWNWAVMQSGISSLKNYIDAPPKNFSVFYQESKNANRKGESALERQKGIVEVRYQDKTWTVDVPFNSSTLFGDLKGVFNVKELLLDNFSEEKFDANLLVYLAKFDVFTRQYGSEMADSIWDK